MASLQGNLFATGAVRVRPGARVERIDLGDGSWLDVARGWLAGADELVSPLLEAVPWRQGRRAMYGRMVDDPRLSRWYRRGALLPHPALGEVGDALEERYGVPLEGPGLNLYRDGRDGVAPHRDRELRTVSRSLVAIVTLGARRPFRLAPAGGGAGIDLAPASGDLIVMGGRCQLDWHHGVPRAAHAGTRISASWRWSSSGDAGTEARSRRPPYAERPHHTARPEGPP